MLEQLQVWILEGLKVRPLRLLADRSMVPRCPEVGQTGSYVLHSLIEVEGKLGLAKDILLLLEGLSQTLNHFLLRFDLFDSVGLLLGLKLDLALEILV